MSKDTQPVNIKACTKLGFLGSFHQTSSSKFSAKELKFFDLRFRASVFNIFPGSLYHQLLKSLGFQILTFQNYFEQNVGYTLN